ncbi:lipocalin family protein [Paraflavitalea pollutisoli]|uniref:lipocalin family protein n=1 Tax=Paraflavitalea pollutisoli TaxID=3034143 RepID=UPI0023EAF4F7|nr:lipocalin family protein [Paraflavitalea sp. H1-2-19X]
MKSTLFILLALALANGLQAQNPVGKWKVLSHQITYEGKSMDMHAALLQQRPCAAKVVWEINADGTYRLNAANSGCDDSYKRIQEKLYAKTKWKLEGSKFTTSATNFAVGQSYTVSFSGNKMIMTGTEGQGIITYQRL